MIPYSLPSHDKCAPNFLRSSLLLDPNKGIFRLFLKIKEGVGQMYTNHKVRGCCLLPSGTTFDSDIWNPIFCVERTKGSTVVMAQKENHLTLNSHNF